MMMVNLYFQGIVFSDRPVEVGERVCLRLTELSIRWSGVLRLGFSSHDPATIQSLPKYACPDLTGKPGFWAKALAEKYAESNALIHYYFSSNGDVHYGINGIDKGLFFSGVDTRQPLWCMIDLYGNCTAIELVDMRRNLNNFIERNIEEEHDNISDESNADTPDNEPDNTDTVENVSNALNNLTVDDEAEIDNDTMLTHLRFNSNIQFVPMSFHETVGLNVSVNASRTVAWRHDDEYSNGYVFTSQPVNIGERFVVQV